YAYPEPDGFKAAQVRPATAHWDAAFGEFVLPYDAVRTAPDPDAALMDFFQSTYEAAADLAQWPRSELERALTSPSSPGRGFRSGPGWASPPGPSPSAR